MSFYSKMKSKLAKTDRVWVLAILGLMAFSLAAYVFELASGQISDFYGSIAMSMSKNISNFWFGASDPGGTITLDKIPGSYWVPAIFVKLFGFSIVSVTLPNALASVALVAVVAATGKRLAGRNAGLLAGAIAATTPILAAVARSNQPESFLLLALAIASYFGIRALQESSLKNLIWSGVWIAIAFHTYMLVAWAVWPALGVAYLFTRGGFAKELKIKIAHVLAAGTTSLVLSFVWIASVMLTPAANRPYIGGSNGNSALEMVFGYNGLGRFATLTSGTQLASSVRSFTPPFSGDPGWFRLLNNQLLPQVGWLVPATLVSIIVLAALRAQKPQAIFVSLFFLVYAAMFSVVSGMHQFYTAALAIPMALVISLAYGTANQAKALWAQILVIATAAFTALYIGVNFLDYFAWAAAVQFALAVVAVILLLVTLKAKRNVFITLSVVGALTFAPAAWALDTRNHPSSINPVAGADSSGFGAGPAGGMGAQQGGNFSPPSGVAPGQNGSSTNSSMIAYLKQHREGAKYLLAVFGTMTAAPLINATGENILPIGGFDGSDPAPSLEQFKKLVETKQLRFVLVGGSGRGSGSGGQSGQAGQSNTQAIQAWVEANCSIDANVSGATGELYHCQVQLKQ